MAGRADEEKRDPKRRIEELLDEIEKGGLRPVDVVENDHQRPLAHELLEDRTHGPEQLVLSVLPLRKAHDRLDATGRVGQPPSEAVRELGAGDLLDVLRRDPGRLPEHLSQWPVRKAVAVGQTATP